MVTLVTDVRVPADAFPLGHVLRDAPDVEIELERLVPAGDAAVPLFWVGLADVEAVEAALRGDPLVSAVRRLTEAGGRVLCSVDWNGGVDSLLSILGTHDVDVLTATGTADYWAFRLQFRDRAHLDAFRKGCREAGVELDLRQLYHPMMPDERGPLTSAQHDVVATAYDNGLWDVPRRTTQTELAGLVGLREQVFSERLREAIRLLVGRRLYGPGGAPPSER